MVLHLLKYKYNLMLFLILIFLNNLLFIVDIIEYLRVIITYHHKEGLSGRAMQLLVRVLVPSPL